MPDCLCISSAATGHAGVVNMLLKVVMSMLPGVRSTVHILREYFMERKLGLSILWAGAGDPGYNGS